MPGGVECITFMAYVRPLSAFAGHASFQVRQRIYADRE